MTHAAALHATCLTKELGSKISDGQKESSAALYSKTPSVGRACFRLVAFCNVRLASCSVEPLVSAMAPGTKPKSSVAVPTAEEGDERAQCHPGNTALKCQGPGHERHGHGAKCNPHEKT